MFHLTRKAEPHQLDEVITNLIASLEGTSEDTSEYAKQVASLQTLMELRNADKSVARQFPVNPDVLASAAANLVGIVMILQWERVNVLTSKAITLLPRIRS